MIAILCLYASYSHTAVMGYETAVSDIVIGLITESVSDGKMTIKENIKFWSFKKKIKK